MNSIGIVSIVFLVTSISFLIGCNFIKKHNKSFKIILGCHFLTNLFFVLSTYFNYNSNKNILHELNDNNQKLVIEKENLIENKKSIENSNLVDLRNDINNLNLEIDNLKETKSKLSQKVESLKANYSKLFSKQVYKIKNFPTFDQKEKYPNGCEMVSLYLLLKFYKVDVDLETLVNELKLGESVHMENDIKYGGNPNIEFVGDPRVKTGSYGVFENPIIDVANKHKQNIKKITVKSFNEIMNIVKDGKPVQIWTSSYGREPRKCNSWVHKESGETITWYCNFHSLVVIGGSPSMVITSDPLTGEITSYETKKIEKAYNLYGRRAIYYD